ncbi:MAG: 4-hydroxy-3-methylbut-2-enyl diphosphate reductase [Paludibacteraceae bacterium]|nr:4-hydroxy-3-methylbut-2-enyl diphosphate reductase [Paludibacteraceae bacterium]
MQIKIDSDSGFCFGVTGAIKKAEEELKKGELYCLGDIVHNGLEVERLSRLGLQTINYEEFAQLHNVRVLLRAHGEPPATYLTAKQNDIDIIDASCPVVKRLQERIRKAYLANTNAQIVLFGKPGHAEVIGLQGQTDNTAIVIEKIEEREKIDFEKDIYLFSQTTKSVEQFMSLVHLISEQPNVKSGKIHFLWHDTICRNVAGRVNKLKQFAKENDVIVFVGGNKSSNAKVLFDNCLQVNPRSYFVADYDVLTAEWLQENNISLTDTIGICGATSTPHWLMEKCKERLENIKETK